MQPIQQEIEKAYFVDNREFKVLSRWEWRRRDSMQVWGVVLEIGRLDDRQILMASAIEPLLIWMTRTRLGFDRIESNGNQKICSNGISVFFFPLCFHVNVSVTEAIPARTALWGEFPHEGCITPVYASSQEMKEICPKPRQQTSPPLPIKVLLAHRPLESPKVHGSQLQFVDEVLVSVASCSVSR